MYEHELAVALNAADAASQHLMEAYERFEVIPDAHASISTDADRQSQEIILQAIRRAFPGDALCAEEATATLGDAAHVGARLWIVDPIDGTRGFARKNGEFSVMIAFVENGAVAVGVVAQPAVGRLTYAVRGEGCWRRDGAETTPTLCQVTAVNELHKCTLTQSRSREPGKRSRWVDALAPAKIVESYSAGIKLALVARGEADLYLNTYEAFHDWDICAGDILVMEAGGIVTGTGDQPILYGLPGAWQKDGLLASNSRLHFLALWTISHSDRGAGGELENLARSRNDRIMGASNVRYVLVRITLAAAMAVGMLMSPKLWLTERSFPHVPVWDGLPTLPPPLDTIVCTAMLLLLVLTAALPRTRWPVLAFVGLTVVYCLFDQMRWQPWVYQYVMMLAVLGLAPTDGDAPSASKDNEPSTSDPGAIQVLALPALPVGKNSAPDRRWLDESSALNACRFILAATYIWSGLQKYNASFATDTYPYIMEPVVKWLPEGMKALVNDHGWTAALIECGLGVALLIWPLRYVAVAMLVSMHGMILYALSPYGHDWNSIVWPWNVAMMVLNLLLFVKTRDVLPWQIVWPRKFWFARVTLVLFGVMPFFDFVGYWDSYLSAALYSGNTLHCRMSISDKAAAKLPAEVRAKHLVGADLQIFYWAIDELNVPPYPARRVFRSIARRLGDSAADIVLDIEERPDWLTGERKTTREVLDDR